jgi:hypothetical protein
LKHFLVGVNNVRHLKKLKKDIFVARQRTGGNADHFLTFAIWYRLSEHKANT